MDGCINKKIKTNENSSGQPHYVLVCYFDRSSKRRCIEHCYSVMNTGHWVQIVYPILQQQEIILLLLFYFNSEICKE